MRRAASPNNQGGDMSNEIRISIIDDDDQSRAALTALMQAMGFKIETFPSAADFLASPNFCHASCLIVDIHMPQMTGMELHSFLTGSGYDLPTILITAYPDDRARARALRQGVVCYLAKPIDDDDLLGCVQSALQRAKPDNI
ncbi:response regulator transcription factor [Bradyrhizobium sp. CCBAU 51627]|uniref:response regulator transcription factor n=1 Tax=Bradyrhizobium sp. CCBAU 51627 TaxID=1325088 RepID=UPI0023059FD4|nr:response regulator [Bradyrhizobium sp. CCBAU 51627]